ncbi:MAG: flavodoxin family protein [Desulfobacterales bacterium]
MLVLGLQGSPRRKGNTHFLLSTFLSEAEKLGAATRMLEVDRMNIVPCKEYVVCEKRGYCPIEDDVRDEIYPLLREADLIVAGTPVFFYNMTAQLKAVIDRCQVFWSRKYRFHLRDPKHRVKQGILLSVAATRGKKLFDAIHLSLQNFFDAVDARYSEHLTYRGIEGPKDMRAHPTVREDVRRLAEKVILPLMGRQRVLFVDQTGTGAGQMAAAVGEDRYGDRFEFAAAGFAPADAPDPAVVDAMAGMGLDVAFRKPRSIEEVLATFAPDRCIFAGEVSGKPPEGLGAPETWRWDAGLSLNDLRDRVALKVDESFARVPE